MRKTLLSLLLVVLLFQISAQSTVVEGYSSSAIRHQLKLFEKAGRVLYLAAHPDDENTRMITWLANEAGVETAYLSLTRGDGGQNLIGPQLGEQLGVIRTQELIEARKIDGGTQFFARAVDFGYSKSADESFEKWGHQAILEDVVTVIRRFKPDVIINRFPPDRRAGHGHHEASAILAEEAFDVVNDPSFHPESAELYGTWEVKNVFWNTSTWWVTDLDTSRVGKGELLHVDVGGYHPLIGGNLGELASASRSMHKSQGFGIAKLRGKIPEYLELVKGEPCTTSVFDHVDTSLARLNAVELQSAIRLIQANFNDDAPWESVKSLIGLYPLVENIEDPDWRRVKVKQLDNLILRCLGLHAEWLAENPMYQSGDNANTEALIVNRSSVPVYVLHKDSLIPLKQNVLTPLDIKHRISGTYNHPFYLEKSPKGNMFDIDDIDLMPLPEQPSENIRNIEMVVYGRKIPYPVELMYKWTDRVKGERYREVGVVPPVSVSFSEDRTIIVNANKRQLRIEVHATTAGHSGQVKLEAPEGWRVSPSIIPYNLEKAGDVWIQNIDIEGESGGGAVRAFLFVNKEWVPAKRKVELDFDHFKPMLLHPNAEVHVSAVNVKRKSKLIGYIPGAGDEVKEALTRIGYEVNVLSQEDIASGNLRRYDAIVAGIRAYNTNTWLHTYESQLMDYVDRGGLYFIQYNTVGWRSAPEALGNWPFSLGRSRVTVEESPVEFIDPSA
ncbi:MAG: PIG-L family deacetylase, partial [Cryomorphaceae bacterium]|nr:PIG-L family deacetylase [Cryomorphaceae bacterium]